VKWMLQTLLALCSGAVAPNGFIGNNEIAGQVMARKLPEGSDYQTLPLCGHLQQYARDGEKSLAAGDDPTDGQFALLVPRRWVLNPLA